MVTIEFADGSSSLEQDKLSLQLTRRCGLDYRHGPESPEFFDFNCSRESTLMQIPSRLKAKLLVYVYVYSNSRMVATTRDAD
jgi:hypothetical protein